MPGGYWGPYGWVPYEPVRSFYEDDYPDHGQIPVYEPHRGAWSEDTYFDRYSGEQYVPAADGYEIYDNYGRHLGTGDIDEFDDRVYCPDEDDFEEAFREDFEDGFEDGSENEFEGYSPYESKW